jgi:hypothetical protein
MQEESILTNIDSQMPSQEFISIEDDECLYCPDFTGRTIPKRMDTTMFNTYASFVACPAVKSSLFTSLSQPYERRRRRACNYEKRFSAFK